MQPLQVGDSTQIQDVLFDFYSIGAELNLEYFDTDANAWLPWQNLPSVSTNQGPDWCTTALPFQSVLLDISSFSLTQASGFQYRFRYDDIFTASNWDWGYCINGVVLTSQTVTPPSAVDVTAPVCEDFEVGIPQTWTQYTTDQADWTRNTGVLFWRNWTKCCREWHCLVSVHRSVFPTCCRRPVYH